MIFVRHLLIYYLTHHIFVSVMTIFYDVYFVLFFIFLTVTCLLFFVRFQISYINR